jgi:hypothetical protein
MNEGPIRRAESRLAAYVAYYPRDVDARLKLAEAQAQSRGPEAGRGAGHPRRDPAAVSRSTRPTSGAPRARPWRPCIARGRPRPPTGRPCASTPWSARPAGSSCRCITCKDARRRAARGATAREVRAQPGRPRPPPAGAGRYEAEPLAAAGIIQKFREAVAKSPDDRPSPWPITGPWPRRGRAWTRRWAGSGPGGPRSRGPDRRMALLYALDSVGRPRRPGEGPGRPAPSLPHCPRPPDIAVAWP